MLWIQFPSCCLPAACLRPELAGGLPWFAWEAAVLRELQLLPRGRRTLGSSPVVDARLVVAMPARTTVLPSSALRGGKPQKATMISQRWVGSLVRQHPPRPEYRRRCARPPACIRVRCSPRTAHCCAMQKQDGAARLAGSALRNALLVHNLLKG